MGLNSDASLVRLLLIGSMGTVAQNKKMKTIPTAIVIAALVAGYGASSARATLVEYDFTYTQTGESDLYGHASPSSTTDAHGQLSVNSASSLATGGWITVSSGPATGTYDLAAGSSNGDGFGFQWDNYVNPTLTPADPYFVDDIGIVFTNGSTEVNLWSNPFPQYGQPEGSYSLWAAFPDYNPESYGIVTLSLVPDPVANPTPSVPDGGMTLCLLGTAMAGLAFFRRKATAGLIAH